MKHKKPNTEVVIRLNVYAKDMKDARVVARTILHDGCNMVEANRQISPATIHVKQEVEEKVSI